MRVARRLLTAILAAGGLALAQAEPVRPAGDWFSPADRPAVGPRLTRSHSGKGWGPARVAVSDPLPAIRFDPAARTPATAQPLTVPASVEGNLAPESSAYLRLAMKDRGQVTLDAVARRLGSPLDPILNVRDLTRDRDVPGAAIDDSPALGGDCRLTLTLDPGAYLVEFRDTQYRGGPDHRFRLRITPGPCPPLPVPLALPRGATTALSWGASSRLVTMPVDAPSASVDFSANAVAWPNTVLVSDCPELVEREPNDDAATATPVPVPGGVTGRFARSGDRDWYRLDLRQGEPVRATVWASELGSPADVLLRLFDSTGKQLAASDPSQNVPRLDYTPPADGAYFIVAEHLNRFFGPDQVYRVAFARPSGFALTLPWLTAQVAAGHTAKIKVIVDRSGYTGPIDLVASGVSGVAGRRRVEVNQSGDIELTIVAEAGTPPRLDTLRLTGTANIAGREVRETAQGRDALIKELTGFRHPPPDWYSAIALAVVPTLEQSKDKQ
ncbi:MAG: PPC domain-containing protein [Gemmataceae bacterium]|nr:PPC domain-containing protein [Gemmataceae bacterium]